MKKVLIITGTLNFGGVERVVLDTAKAFIKNGDYQPIILNLTGRGEFQNQLKKLGIESLSLNQGALNKNVIGNLLKTRRLIKACQPNIIHTHQFASDFYGSIGALGLHIPIISHIHNTDVEFFSRRIIRYLLGRFFIDGFIATTEEKFRELKKSFSLKKVFLLFNAIDQENLQLPEDFDRIKFQAQLSIPKANIIIGAVGRLSWEKGYDLLLSAFAQTLKKIPNASLILVGEGTEEKKLKGMAIDLGIADKVIFTGYREDVASLLSIFDVFVISSRLESFSLVALEAMFLGIPVIITDKLSSKEIFAPAVMTVPLSVDGLENGIVSLLNNREQKEMMIANGKRLVKDQFIIEIYMKKLEEIYSMFLS